jgi:hypothetical protein
MLPVWSIDMVMADHDPNLVPGDAIAGKRIQDLPTTLIGAPVSGVAPNCGTRSTFVAMSAASTWSFSTVPTPMGAAASPQPVGVTADAPLVELRPSTSDLSERSTRIGDRRSLIGGSCSSA